MTAGTIITVVILATCIIPLSAASSKLPWEYRKRVIEGQRNVTKKPQSDCPQSSYSFPNQEQTTNYLRVKNPIPTIGEFTMCFLLTRNSKTIDSWISYSNSQNSNAILIETKNDDIIITIRDEGLKAPLKLPTNKEFHICIASFVSTSAAERSSFIFVDGELKEIVRHSSPSSITGDGVFIIGQDQDIIGRGFSSGQSVQGRVSNLMMWGRILQDKVLAKMFSDHCWCPSGRIVSLEADNVAMFGGVAASMTKKCAIKEDVETQA